MSQVILIAATAAAASNAITVIHGATLPAHFTCPGIAGSETGTLQKKNADATWSDYVINTDEHIVSASRAGVVVYAPGIYRINKSITAAAVPVEVSTSVIP